MPLREGGSLPGVLEGSDDGTWVVKFSGAGQGVKALVAEVIVGELARRVGLHVPALKVVELPQAIAKYEADEEVQDLLTASVGLNLAMDLLPGALAYDGATPPSASEAARIMWLDAFTANIDRTPHNPNLVVWHGQTWLIDHGAALYFHHSWPGKGSHPERFAAQLFDSSNHILFHTASGHAWTHQVMTSVVTDEVLDEVVNQVPDEWLELTQSLPSTSDVRRAYLENLVARRDNPAAWSPAYTCGEMS